MKKRYEVFIMKKFFNSISTKISAMATRAKTAVAAAATSTAGEGYVDSGVKILIAVVIGALLLSGLYALFNTTIMPTVTNKITELFNFAG